MGAGDAVLLHTCLMPAANSLHRCLPVRACSSNRLQRPTTVLATWSLLPSQLGQLKPTCRAHCCRLQVWDLRTRKLKVDLPGHADEVFTVDWSPDGMSVASGGKDRVLKLWRH